MRIVTSYTNPDLDGLASGVIYARYLAPMPTNPVFTGRGTSEALGVLDLLGLKEEVSWIPPERKEWEDITLVDCHHPAQLPHICQPEVVSLVIDHHSDGNADAFPNAVIQNEMIGAAATLVAERLRSSSLLSTLSSEHAALLAAAIASNTLDFQAPSTTVRDRTAYEDLATLVDSAISLNDLRAAMREWRQEFLSMTTLAAIESDFKLIETSIGLVVVSQLEGNDARLLADRSDIFDQLSALIGSTGAFTGLISLVDTASATTTLITEDSYVGASLLRIDAMPVRHGTFELPFIALRKTHIIPALLGNA